MRSALRFKSDAKLRWRARVIGIFSFNQVNSVATFLGPIFSLVHKVPGREKNWKNISTDLKLAFCA